MGYKNPSLIQNLNLKTSPLGNSSQEELVRTISNAWPLYVALTKTLDCLVLFFYFHMLFFPPPHHCLSLSWMYKRMKTVVLIMHVTTHTNPECPRETKGFPFLISGLSLESQEKKRKSYLNIHFAIYFSFLLLNLAFPSL